MEQTAIPTDQQTMELQQLKARNMSELLRVALELSIEGTSGLRKQDLIFKILEAMAEGGVKMGLPREVSQRISAQVLKGAAELVLRTGRHPASLKDEVTTPGGCTIDGIAKLQERGISIALIDAVETSTRKAGALWGEG